MVRDELKHASRIERKPQIPDSVRTEGKDRAADWIDSNAAENWNQWTLQDVASQTEWSRQHIANTLDDYFRPTRSKYTHLSGDFEEKGLESLEESLGVLTIREFLVYRAGYRDGRLDAREGVPGNDELFEDT